MKDNDMDFKEKIRIYNDVINIINDIESKICAILNTNDDFRNKNYHANVDYSKYDFDSDKLLLYIFDTVSCRYLEDISINPDALDDNGLKEQISAYLAKIL